MDGKNKIGEKLRYYRKKLGLTQKELGDKSGVSYASISDYEKGKAVPRRETLMKLSEALGVGTSELETLELNEKEIESEEKELKLFKALFKDLLMELAFDIPVYRTIPAGKPEETGAAVEYIKMPKSIASTVDYAIKVKGMSLIEEGIFEGCTVFVKRQNHAEDRDIVIAKRGADYAIKRYRKTASESWLEPVNRNFAFGKGEFEIVGVIKYVLRSL